MYTSFNFLSLERVSATGKMHGIIYIHVFVKIVYNKKATAQANAQGTLRKWKERRKDLDES